MHVSAEKITDDRLMRAACRFTINAESNMTLAKIYQCEHSPMRTQLFWVELVDIPTFVSVHLVRHKIGVEHYVKSNRTDRASHSGDLGRMQPVNHAMLINAQALINMARKRLCRQASPETRQVMAAIRAEIHRVDPDLAGRMVPDCVYRGRCYELKPCNQPPTEAQ